MCNDKEETHFHQLAIIFYTTHQVGFEITRVNGFTLSESTHDEVINLIKMKRKLLLSCKGEKLSTAHNYYHNLLQLLECCQNKSESKCSI